LYHEPDWSSLSLLELLEKAQDFATKAYPSSLSTLAFLAGPFESQIHGRPLWAIHFK